MENAAGTLMSVTSAHTAETGAAMSVSTIVPGPSANRLPGWGPVWKVRP